MITQLCNRARTFTRMVESMREALGTDDELIVVDYESNDCNVQALLDQHVPGKYYLVKRKRPFRLCRGLNIGAHVAKGDILFYTHADCIHPKNCCDTICSNVKPGQVYFPIFGWLQKHGGEPYWSPGAFGVLGNTRENNLPWNEAMDRVWGYQDLDIRNRHVAKGHTIIRTRLEGMFHIHHETRKDVLEQYYAKRPEELKDAPYPDRA